MIPRNAVNVPPHAPDVVNTSFDAESAGDINANDDDDDENNDIFSARLAATRAKT